MTRYPNRAALSAAVTHSLRHDSHRDFRRDLDKALEAVDLLTGPGYFEGRYWAERAIADLVAFGCDLTVERIDREAPLFRIVWGKAQTV